MTIVGALALTLAASFSGTETSSATTDAAEGSRVAGTNLADVIDHPRRDEKRASDKWRHPLDTLPFFGIEPDMTIVEVLPGNGGWYTQMARHMSIEGVESAQPIVGYTIDNIPDEEDGQADAVLFIRAMHHLFRFEEPLIDTALPEVFDALAPGGVVGVVQHRVPEDADAEFANGNNGYLKQSDVVAYTPP